MVRNTRPGRRNASGRVDDATKGLKGLSARENSRMATRTYSSSRMTTRSDIVVRKPFQENATPSISPKPQTETEKHSRAGTPRSVLSAHTPVENKPRKSFVARQQKEEADDVNTPVWTTTGPASETASLQQGPPVSAKNGGKLFFVENISDVRRVA
jgi:hypothetical protein